MNRRASDVDRNWRIVRVTGGLGTLGLSVDSVVGTPLGPTYAQLFAIAVCSAIWVWSLVRRAPPMASSNVAILALNAAIIVALFSGSQRIAESGVDWIPFRPNQLGAMAVALLAPPAAWVGVTAITGFVMSAVVQVALFDPAIRARLPFGVLFSTIMFGVFALVLLFYRLRADRVERDVVRAQAEAESYQRYARAMLAIRDLSNTPLQTLTNLTEVLRQHGPRLRDAANCLDRSVARLTELERATRPFEHKLEWQPGDESLDPKMILQLAEPPHDGQTQRIRDDVPPETARRRP